MKILNKLSAVLCMVGLLALGSVSVTSCDDELSTNQYKGGISLNVFGPSPVLRGGEIRFLGSGMNQVTAVVFPGGIEVTEITVVSDTEIRVTVPQTAEEGYLTLKTPAGDIVTKTKLTYLEPVTIESFSPAAVRPGDELTITGDYLNLMHAVVFEGTTEDVVVPEYQFIEHTRQIIRVTVPDMAITGRIALSDAAEEGLPNVMYAEGELTVIVPSEETVQVENPKEEYRAGEEVTIIGQDLDLVEELRMSNGETIEFTCKEIANPNAGAETAHAKSGTDEAAPESTSGRWFRITFTIPENASSGAVMMVTHSGVEVELMVLEMAKPEVTTETPITELRPNGEITLAGSNLDLVENVGFTGVEEPVKPTSVSENELKVTMPEMAKSGKMYLITAGRDSVGIDIETLKPTFTSYSPAESVEGGETLTVTGTDLDLVEKVIVGEEEVTAFITKENTSLSFAVPMPAANYEATIVLQMKNGEEVKCEPITVILPAVCTIVGDGPYTANVSAENMNWTIDVMNVEKLTEVKINGSVVSHTTDGDRLIITIPDDLYGKATLELISGDKAPIEYEVEVVVEEVTVLWTGEEYITGWAQSNASLESTLWSNAVVGDIVRLNFIADSTQTWWQIGLKEMVGNWNTVVEPTISDKNQTSVDIEITNELLSTMQANGVNVSGQNITLTRVLLIK